MSLDLIAQQIREEISKLTQALRVLEGIGSKRATGQGSKPTRNISAAGRKRIAAAQRKRWAKIRRAKG
jgi:hypothetical protein